MKKLLMCVVVASMVCVMSGFSFATVITHGGSGGVFTVNNGTASAPSSQYFDRAEFMFSPEWADTVTISNTGAAAAHIHLLGDTAVVEVFDGSSWINVFTAAPLPSSGLDMPLSTVFAGPMTFPGMNISGLRLDIGGGNAGNTAQMYHWVPGSMTYTTNVTTPEPATVILFGIGGLAAFRRRRKL